VAREREDLSRWKSPPLAATSCRRAMQERHTSGKAPFSTYLQTANVRGEQCRPTIGAIREGEPTQRLCMERRKPWSEKCCRDGVSLCLERSSPAPAASWPGSGEAALRGPSSLGFLRAFTGKQYRRCGVLRERAWEVQVLTLSEPRLRMLLAGDSGTVVMKVDTRSGVCNNSPAKASSSENEWRSRALHTPSLLRNVDCGGGRLPAGAIYSRLKLCHVEGYQGALSSDPLGGGEEAPLRHSGMSRGRCPLESRSGLQ